MSMKEYLKYFNISVTEEIRKFVKAYVFGNSEYLFVKNNAGSSICYCSKCGAEFQTEEKLKHNEMVTCPCCKSAIQIKLLRYGRGKCFNEACFYYFEKSIIDPNVVICKGYYVSKDYVDDYKKPKENYELNAIYIFKDTYSIMLKFDYWSKGYEIKKSIFDFNIGWLANKMCYCSFESMHKAIIGTKLNYLPYKIFEGYYSMVKLFDEYIRHRGIEYLVKEGLEQLVKDKFDGQPTHHSIDWNGKTISMMLKMSKGDLKEIKAKNIHITFKFLKLFQTSKRYKWNLSIEKIVKLSQSLEYSQYSILIQVNKYATVKKILNYLDKQYLKFNESNEYYSSKIDVLTTFKDYIEDCKLLSMNLEDKHVLFPKNLHVAHENTIKQIKIEQNKVYDSMIQKRLSKLENKYSFQYNGYLIRPAASTEELIEEGKVLDHCVATHYTVPYAKGNTVILFVRKICAVEKPFCTVEVKSNAVIQAYIRYDRVPDKETLSFLEVFKKAKLTQNKYKKKIA